jgi:hypothetical protein
MPRSDWRSPAVYAYVSDLDPSGFAWEFLRRNPEYRREYRAVSGESQSNDQAEAASSAGSAWARSMANLPPCQFVVPSIDSTCDGTI